MPEELQLALAAAIDTATVYGMQVVGALLILILGLWLAGRAGRWTAAALKRNPRMDEMLVSFLSSLVKYLVIAAVLIAVLDQFGVETTSLIALLGAASLAVGLALQGTLTNIAAGVMLLLFRPFKSGQYVDIAGTSGTVGRVTLFVTELATPDNVQIIVPNKDVWGQTIKNYSHHPLRRLDLVFGIAYGAEIDRAIAVIAQTLDADPRALDEPPRQIVVGGLGDSSVDLFARVWVKADDYWGLRFDLTKAVKEAFDANGIGIPFPTRTVVMDPQPAAPVRGPIPAAD